MNDNERGREFLELLTTGPRAAWEWLAGLSTKTATETVASLVGNYYVILQASPTKVLNLLHLAATRWEVPLKCRDDEAAHYLVGLEGAGSVLATLFYMNIHLDWQKVEHTLATCAAYRGNQDWIALLWNMKLGSGWENAMTPMLCQKLRDFFVETNVLGMFLGLSWSQAQTHPPIAPSHWEWLRTETATLRRLSTAPVGKVQMSAASQAFAFGRTDVLAALAAISPVCLEPLTPAQKKKLPGYHRILPFLQGKDPAPAEVKGLLLQWPNCSPQSWPFAAIGLERHEAKEGARTPPFAWQRPGETKAIRLENGMGFSIDHEIILSTNSKKPIAIKTGVYSCLLNAGNTHSETLRLLLEQSDIRSLAVPFPTKIDTLPGHERLRRVLASLLTAEVPERTPQMVDILGLVEADMLTPPLQRLVKAIAEIAEERLYLYGSEQPLAGTFLTDVVRHAVRLCPNYEPGPDALTFLL